MISRRMFNIIKNESDQDTEEDEYYLQMKEARDLCFLPNKSSIEYQSDSLDNDTMFCPRNFDGRMCWDAIPAGTSLTQKCPEYLVGPGVEREVVRRCLKDGYWFTKGKQMRPWSPYLECFSPDTDEFDTLVKDIFAASCVTAITCLIFAILVLTVIRSIRYFQLQIHYKLFAALLMDDIFWIIWFNAVILKSELNLQNIVVIKKHVMGKWICMVGWIIPSLCISAYATKRFNEGRNHPFWLTPIYSHWANTIPIVISLFLTMYFLIDIVIVIVAKMVGSPEDSYIIDFLYIIKAPLVLVPIFGLHFVMIPYRPPENNILYHYWGIIKSKVCFFKDVCISLPFCIMNKVRSLRRRINRYRRLQRSQKPSSGTNLGKNANITREHSS